LQSSHFGVMGLAPALPANIVQELSQDAQSLAVAPKGGRQASMIG